MLRLIHTADWQLGKPYGRFDSDVRAALGEARFDAIGKAAVEHGAAHVLVAGDVFDTEGPEDRVIVQAVSRMQRYACTWWLLPGNHDFARNSGLWDRVRAKGAANIRVVTEAVPCELEPGHWLLPAPLTHRHNLDDPTAVFDTMETPGATLRIGLAHGSIRDFSSRGEAQNQIAPDRAQRSQLDYLALGDWHGCKQIDARTWYSGTPETDRFRANEPGFALRVQIDAPGAPPQVEPIPIGRYRWSQSVHALAVASDADAVVARLAALDESDVAQISLQGETDLHSLERIKAALSQAEARARSLSVDFDALRLLPTDEDILALNADGYLGDVIATLRDRQGGAQPQVATQALALLTTLLAERRAAGNGGGGMATQGATA